MSHSVGGTNLGGPGLLAAGPSALFREVRRVLRAEGDVYLLHSVAFDTDLRHALRRRDSQSLKSSLGPMTRWPSSSVLGRRCPWSQRRLLTRRATARAPRRKSTGLIGEPASADTHDRSEDRIVE